MNRVRALAAQMPRRAYWSIADQGISSASNFVFVAAVARASDVRAFGSFALAYVVYGLVLGILRAGGGDILLLRAEQDPTHSQRDSRRLLGLALMSGPLAAMLLAGAALGAGSSATSAAFTLSLVLPVVLVQDALRYCLFARGSAAGAAVNDLTWLVAQLLGVAALLLTQRHISGQQMVLVWGFGAGAASAVGFWQVRLPPTLSQLHRWATEDRARVASFIGDFGLMSGAGLASVYIVAVLGGIGAVAGVRGSSVVFAPLDALFLGVRIFVLPSLARAVRLGGVVLLKRAQRIAVGSVAVSLSWSIVAVSLPDRAGRAILGPTWSVAQPLLLAMALVSTARYTSLPAQAALRAMGDVRRIVQLRVFVTVLVLCGAAGGTILNGAEGAVEGLAGAYSLEALFSWVAVLRSSNRVVAL